MIKSLLIIFSVLNAPALTLKFGDVIDLSKQYMEVPVEANKLASNLSSEEKAGLKVLWFNFELLPAEAKDVINGLNEKEVTVLAEAGSSIKSDSEEEVDFIFFTDFSLQQAGEVGEHGQAFIFRFIGVLDAIQKASNVLWVVDVRQDSHLKYWLSDITFDVHPKYMAEVTKKSPELGAKLKKVNDMIDSKIATLKPEGQAFAKKIMDFVGMNKYFDNPKEASPALVKDLTLGVIEKYKTLNDDAKEDIKKEFPVLAAFLTSEETVKRLQEH